MDFILDGVREAWHLILHPDAELRSAFDVTVRVAFFATLLSLVLGIPTGLLFGLRSFRGRWASLSLVNAGLGLPPVVVGLVVSILLFRNGPFGGLNLLYTVNGVIIAQALLAFPIVAAFTASAVQAVPTALLDQASVLGASKARVALLALREARVGILAAVIAALGSALSEVGAVVLVGGNIQDQTQTLASAVLAKVSAGEYGPALAYGFILLGLILVLAAILTLLQQRGAMRQSWRAS